MKLRVATYNIHKGVTVRGRPRIRDVRKALQAMNADIVFLQEVQDRNERLAARHATYPQSTQIEFLAAQIYEHHAYGMNAVYPHGHHGNAILSRYVIRQFTNHDVSDHALEKRGLLHAVCRVGKRDVHLICVHFGLFKRSRLRQASFLIDFVDSEVPAKAPLIIGGDFNDWQRRVDTELRRRLGVSEVSDAAVEPTLLDRLLPWRDAGRSGGAGKARLARTYPALLPWLHLDRIYLRGLRVTSVEVPRGPAWAKRSDHVPLIAEVQFR